MKNIIKVLFIMVMLVIAGAGAWAFYEDNEDTERIITEPVRRDGCTCPLDRNLPIFFINTAGQDINTVPERMVITDYKTEVLLWEPSPRYRVMLTLYEPGEYGYTCICGGEEPSFSQEVTISLRGQSTLGYEKKQYSLTLEDDEYNDQPRSLLGMPKHHQWVLNASYVDKSLLRNALAYTMAGEIMEYAPRFEFCEVLMNTGDTPLSFDDDYLGVYLLMEKIKRSPKRVSIKKVDERYGDTSFIIARDKFKSDDALLHTDWGALEDDFIMGYDGRVRFRTVLTCSYPDLNQLPEYSKRIESYVNDFEYALGSKNFEDRSTGYRNYIDVDSFVEFAMINEVLKNTDGGEASTYFYKDLGGKMKAGPVWDFDLTLGNLASWETENAAVQDPTGMRITNVAWFSRLFQDPYFSGKFNYSYKRLRSSSWTNEEMADLISDLQERLGPAAERNTKRWYSGPKSDFDYQREVDDLREFIRLRMEWMDRNIHLVYRLKQNDQ